MNKTNSKHYLKSAIAIVGAALFSVSQTGATTASIQLYNTGVNGSGGLLSDSTIDPHYSVIAAPSPYTTAYTGNGSDVSAMPWLADGPNSRWIGVTAWMGEWRPTGTYTFRTTFDLSGMIPSSASINLSIVSDNTCNVYLNGVHTGITTPFAVFDSFSAYSISAGFVNGLNTLDFEVYEPGSTPSGLRVELSGYATPVPEPTVAGLAGLAGMVLIFIRRRQEAGA
jgi:hypothetical protein